MILAWIVVLAIVAPMVLFVIGACKVAARADEASEKAYKEDNE